MRSLLLALVLLVACTAASQEFEIDWENVKPIEEFDVFWTARGLTPPKKDNSQIAGRIVRGSVATEFPRQFPYQVVLFARFPEGQGICGASVISRRTILTAAHCISLQVVSSSAIVIAGAHNIRNNEPQQQRFNVLPSHYQIHADWDLSTISNDIALINLPSNVIYNDHVQPISLPSNHRQELFSGEQGVVSGWGVYGDSHGRTSDVLRFVRHSILANSACSPWFPGVIREGHICLSGSGGLGACQGDSGGPLTVQRGGRSIQVGIVSFGMAAGCELPWPSVFVRVTSYYNWITQRWIQD